MSINQQEQLTLTIAALIIHRFNNNLSPLNDEEIAAKLATNPMTIERALRHLVNSGLLAKTGDDPPRYLPAGSVADTTLVQIWRSLREANASEFHENFNLPEYQQAGDFLRELDQAAAEKLGNKKFVDSA